MGEQCMTADLVERDQKIPEIVRILGKILTPRFLPLVDLLCPYRIAKPLGLAELGALQGHLQA
jgi:hypothetical protein